MHVTEVHLTVLTLIPVPFLIEALIYRESVCAIRVAGCVKVDVTQSPIYTASY
jgi:hypothetical protein